MSKAPTDMAPWPAFIEERIKLWDKLKAEYDAEIAAKESEPIQITLPDGKIHEGKTWRTTPFEIAERISKGLAEAAVIAKVNGAVWDLDRPFEGNAKLELLKFDDDEAKQVSFLFSFLWK